MDKQHMFLKQSSLPPLVPRIDRAWKKFSVLRQTHVVHTLSLFFQPLTMEANFDVMDVVWHKKGGGDL